MYPEEEILLIDLFLWLINPESLFDGCTDERKPYQEYDYRTVRL